MVLKEVDGDLTITQLRLPMTMPASTVSAAAVPPIRDFWVIGGHYQVNPWNLTGLESLQQVRGRVSIAGTSIRSPNLSGLVCIGQSLSIQGNFDTVGLATGMGRLASIYNPTPMADGAIIYISENYYELVAFPSLGDSDNETLFAPSSMAVLARLGNCGGALPQGQSIRVQASRSRCVPFLNWADFCAYVSTGVCSCRVAPTIIPYASASPLGPPPRMHTPPTPPAPRLPPPPSPLPPQVSCPLSLGSGGERLPVCGNSSTSVTVYIEKLGNCTWKMGPPTSNSSLATCAGPIFKSVTSCGSFPGGLAIILPPNADDSPYQINVVQQGLDMLGLGGITYVGSLSMDFSWVSNDGFITGINLWFLNSLREVGGDLTIKSPRGLGTLQSQQSSTAGVGPDPTIPELWPPVSTAPTNQWSRNPTGLDGLQQVGGRVAITGTPLLNPSLLGLMCIGQSLSIQKNYGSYATLAARGMDSLVSIYNPTPMPDGTIINISENSPLFVQGLFYFTQSMAALARVGNCGRVLPQGQSIRVEVSECLPFLNWPDLCAYVATSVCTSIP
eukprot:jgi/Botrbrau1/5972/Bobra.104_1s0004.1